jgi:hypothetical protein
MVGSASAEESAYEPGSFTERLTGEQAEDETPTEGELTESMEGLSGQAIFHSQHPSLAQIGIRPDEIKGKKRAVYIGNETYLPPQDSLPGATADARRMKSTMERHNYETIAHEENKNAPGIHSLYSDAMSQAESGQALFLYYAGHGLPEGLVGVEAVVRGVEEPSPAPAGETAGAEQAQGSESQGATQGATGGEAAAEGQGAERGLVLVRDQVTDVEPYRNIMGILETGVAKGVHTTFVADSCHAGAGTDMVRAQAIERLAESGNQRATAVLEQIRRLQDMIEQIPGGGGGSSAQTQTGSAARGEGAPEGSTARGLVFRPGVELVPAELQTYWDETVHPELTEVGEYLSAAGMPVDIPARPSNWTAAGIEQAINQVINRLIDLGEQLQQEEGESTLEKAAE